MADKPFDVTLFGATGFTGRQAARYFAAHAPPGLRWCVAGRNLARLEALKAETGASGIAVADSSVLPSIDRMVAQSRVLLSTAGPFARYSAPVVDACVRHGVDYTDITGETVWVRGLVDRYHATAASQGTRIVPFCGFDSVPSDLGTLFLADWIRRHWSQPTRRVSASFALRGGLNGGTLATMLWWGPEDRRRAQDVLLLNPPGATSEEERARSPEFSGVRFDRTRGVWLTPFAMAPINTRVVRRSNGLLAEGGEGYGPQFGYEEAVEVRSRTAAHAIDLGMRAADRILQSSFGRELARRLGPKPGEGPSEKVRESGFMRVRFLGEAEDGRRVLATMRAHGDPGNRLTVLFVCEAAFSLAGQRDSLPGAPGRGGVLTPATGLGLPYLERIRGRGVELALEVLEPGRARGQTDGSAESLQG